MTASPPPPNSPRGRSSDDGGNDEPERLVLAGRYRLERRLAQGGMAEVWVADDLQLDRRVAVKWLKPSLATDPIVAERFRREAVAVAGLSHPNIVNVFDAFEHDGRQAVVMQLVEGQSLRQMLDVQKRLSPDLTLHIGMSVAAALDAAHTAGFVHRDVKPGNILLTPDGRVMLTDFGIAKGLDGDDDLTGDNVMMGTAKYLSPEQVRGRKLDGRADLYSLGLVLYECLVGRVPFVGATDADTALARLQRDPTDLARLRPTLSPGLVEVVHGLLSRNPNRRPASGAALRTALQTARADHAEFTGRATTSAPNGAGRQRPRGRGRPAGPRPATAAATGSRPNDDRQRRARGASRRPEQPAVASEPVTPQGTAVDAPAVVGEPPRLFDQIAHQTPTAGPELRGRPARGMQTRIAPSLVLVCLLVAVGLVVALVLYAAIRPDDPLAGEATTTIATPANDPANSPDGATTISTQPPAIAPTTSLPLPGAVTLRSATAFDPKGDNQEFDDLASAALADGDATTFWVTECYSNQYTGKEGVGLIVALSGPAANHALQFAIDTAPYQVDVYASAAGEQPTTLEAFGSSLEHLVGNDVGEHTVDLPDGTRFALVWFVEIGRDGTCSAERPHRGAIGELAIVAQT